MGRSRSSCRGTRGLVGGEAETTAAAAACCCCFCHRCRRRRRCRCPCPCPCCCCCCCCEAWIVSAEASWDRAVVIGHRLLVDRVPGAGFSFFLFHALCLSLTFHCPFHCLFTASACLFTVFSLSFHFSPGRRSSSASSPGLSSIPFWSSDVGGFSGSRSRQHPSW